MFFGGFFWVFFSVAEPEPIFFWSEPGAAFFKAAPAASFRQAKTKSLVLVKKLDIKGSLEG